MRPNKRLTSFVLGTLIILVSFILDLYQQSDFGRNIVTPIPEVSGVFDSTNSVYKKSPVKVIKVIDGDTIQIEGGVKVRYIGIDTPETADPRRADGCFGLEASNKNKELVLGKEVTLEKDVSETDSFGRLLRYVYIGDQMVNEKLLRDGYAKVSTYPPDVKFVEKFLESEKYARENGLGLWIKCL